MANLPEVADRLSSSSIDGEYAVPKDSIKPERSIASPVGSTSERSEALSATKTGKLSRRATFAPAIAESIENSPMQPLLFQHSGVAKQPSVIKQASVTKQSSIITQFSLAKQFSIAKHSSMPKQPSVASQASIVSQASTSRFRSAESSKPQCLSTRKSMEKGKPPTRRSSSNLQTRKSLQSMKTVKIDDMLHDYKFAVERKAKPAEARVGQHALELDDAMKRLTLEWIVKSFVSSQFFDHHPAFTTTQTMAHIWSFMQKICFLAVQRDAISHPL